MEDELINLLKHQTLNITDQSENKWKVVEASDIQDIIDKSREGLHGVYCTMTPKEIAHKYVHGNHDALTDNQEKLYMVADIEEYAKQKDERIKELEALKDEVLKVWNEDGDNGEIQMRTPIAWHRVLRIAEKL